MSFPNNLTLDLFDMIYTEHVLIFDFHDHMRDCEV